MTTPIRRLKRADARMLLCVFAVVLIAAVWGLTLYQLAVAKRVHVESAERDAKSLARLFEEHATRTIEAADQAVTYLRQRYNVLGPALDIAQDLKSGLDPADIYNLFTIVDEKGDVVLSTKPFQPMNLSDREHVRVHMNADTGNLFISKPVQGRVSKKWSIQMTRRMNYPDGRFKGVVVVSMDPQYFTRLYRDIDVGRKGTISLIGEDGVIRVRRVGAEDSRGQNVANAGFFRRMLAEGSGVTRSVSSLDGRERIVAFDKVRGYPLYAVVGIDLEERFAAYYATRMQLLILATVISAIVLLFTAALIIVVGQLVASREQAIAASRAKSRFVANMSHELRTPLNGILGYSDMLREESGDPLHREFADTIYECGTRLLGLVDAVLELSALDAGKTPLSMRPERLADLLEHALQRHLAPASAKQLRLFMTVADRTPATFVCDRAKLGRVVDGLLDNAVRLTERGTVRLDVRADGSSIVLAVVDTGPGVPVALQEQIFETFSQADDSPSRANGGAGLGLAIAGRLVRLMGGTLSLVSSPGHGAAFTIVLPVKDAYATTA